MKDLRFLLLTDGLSPFVTGGMQQHSTLLAKHLAPIVEHLTVVHCETSRNAIPSTSDVLNELGNPDNVEVIGLPFRDDGFLPGHYPRASRRLSVSYLEHTGDLTNYDVVYAQGLMGDAFLKRHPKVIVNLHGLEMFQEGFSIQERLSKAMLRPIFRKQIRNAWKCVSLGGQLSEILKTNGAAPEKIAQLPNGIASDWILSDHELRAKKRRRKKSETRFVMIGRNEHRKGLSVLQDAMKIIESPIELVMVGDWPIWDVGIHNVIRFGVVRKQSRVMSILDDSDVLLVPSLAEGMPTVILEAAARGVDIIATDVGAIGAFFSDVIPPNDSSQLAAAMAELKLSKLKVDLREFSWGKVAQKTVDCAKN